MRRLLALLACLALAAPALAVESKTSDNKQQNRMKVCNERAAGKKGDERKALMSKCLKGEDEAPAAGNSQQHRMKDCNEKAAGKKGDERKKFMSDCLKG
jgi:hypothetical protein